MDITNDNSAGLDNSPQDYLVLQQLGEQWASTGDYTAARRCYETAASLRPDEPDPYVGLGMIDLENKRTEDAEIAFRVAIRLDRGCAMACCGLGLIYQQKNNLTKAFEMYLKCLESDTDNLTALLGLFQISCRFGSFLKIRYYLEIYLKIHPCDTKVMFCLATLCMNDGQLNKTKKIVSKILTLTPTYTDAVNLLEEVNHLMVRKKIS